MFAVKLQRSKRGLRQMEVSLPGSTLDSVEPGCET